MFLYVPKYNEMSETILDATQTDSESFREPLEYPVALRGSTQPITKGRTGERCPEGILSIHVRESSNMSLNYSDAVQRTSKVPPFLTRFERVP